MSALRINYSPVVRSDRPHERLQVFLEINRPDLNFGLSQEFERLLLHERQTLRW